MKMKNEQKKLKNSVMKIIRKEKENLLDGDDDKMWYSKNKF